MKLIKKIIICIGISLLFAESANAQFYSVRTNTLGWLTASPNFGIEIAANHKTSFDFEFMGNFLSNEHFSTQHIMAQQGMRFWLLENNAGSFFGFHFTEALYNIGDANYMHKGWTAGVGASYGHVWLLSKRWNVGVEIGGSIMYMDETKSDRNPHFGQDAYIRRFRRVALMPTKMSLSFIYIF